MTRTMTLAVSLVAMMSSWTTAAETSPIAWQSLPPLPDREGFAAMFAGTSVGSLVVAGGANFPDQRPWEGGTKKWYDAVWALDRPEGTWQQVGKLPRPAAYGISVTTPQGVVCAGGSDARGHQSDVFRLSLVDGEAKFAALPPLPRPCANASSALVGDTLYLSGGIDQPEATACLHTFWSFDLSQPEAKWQTLKPCPGGERMLAVAGADERSFYLFGGTRLSAGPDGKPLRKYLRDAWRFRPDEGWQRVADLPRSAVAAPSPAPRLADGRLLVVSGDDGTKVGYKPETEHPGFPRDVLAYDPVTELFDRVGEAPFSLATAPTTPWRAWIVIPSGEARPGYRSPAVWGLRVRPR